MLRGLYTAASGMVTEMTRTDVISNNVANVNTTGYKKDETISREFEEMVLRRINDNENAPEIARASKDAQLLFERGFIGGQAAPVVGDLGRGSLVDEIATIHEQGAYKQTGNTYDLSIQGRGYFVIETPQGDRYTRNGAFMRSADGMLVTTDGFRVLGQNGRPIYIPEGQSVTIGAQGLINVDGEEAGTVALVDFADRRALLKTGNNLFTPQEGQAPQAAVGSIEQGALEMSNVNVVSEMVNLISAYRAYEANSKAVTTQDSLLEKAVNEVGRA